MADDKAKRLRGQALKEANAAIAKLKKAGLYAGKKAIGQPTKYALSLVRKFSDVITDKSKAVKVNKTAAREYAETFRVKSSRVIVPIKPEYNETVRVIKSKKKGEADEIAVYSETVSGAKKKRIITPKAKTTDGTIRYQSHLKKLRSLEGKPGVMFILPLNRGRRGVEYIRSDRLNDLLSIVSDYVRRSSAKSAKESDVSIRIFNWQQEITYEVNRTKG